MSSPEEDRDIEELHEIFLFNYLPNNFPEEFEQLCLIPPIKQKEELISAVRLNVGAIICKHRNRFTGDADYFARIEKCIQKAQSAEKSIKDLVDLFLGMDNDHRELALRLASEIAPRVFESRKLGDLLEQLVVAAMKMEVLAAAVSVCRGATEENRGKGRPMSKYILPAFELMQEWQFITAEPMTVGEAVIGFSEDLTPAERRMARRIVTPFDGRKIKTVPTPRPLGKGSDKDPTLHYVEHSTAFIGLCLKMISPEITRQEVISAIKHAVKLRAGHTKIAENMAGGKSMMLALSEAVRDKK